MFVFFLWTLNYSLSNKKWNTLISSVQSVTCSATSVLRFVLVHFLSSDSFDIRLISFMTCAQLTKLDWSHLIHFVVFFSSSSSLCVLRVFCPIHLSYLQTVELASASKQINYLRSMYFDYFYFIMICFFAWSSNIPNFLLFTF